MRWAGGLIGSAKGLTGCARALMGRAMRDKRGRNCANRRTWCQAGHKGQGPTSITQHAIQKMQSAILEPPITAQELPWFRVSAGACVAVRQAQWEYVCMCIGCMTMGRPLTQHMSSHAATE